jgi:hypothetical protein
LTERRADDNALAQRGEPGFQPDQQKVVGADGVANIAQMAG